MSLNNQCANILFTFYLCIMILTDTHIHLYAEEFDTDRKQLLSEAVEHQVTRFFLPNIDSSSLGVMLDLQQQFPENCFPMMGLHPCYVKEKYKSELAKVESELSRHKYFGVGEIGMDLYWDKTFLKQQEEAFIRQITWASELDLPVSIHSRNATEEVIELLDRNSNLKVRGVFHCFSGTLPQAQKITEKGFYLGIGGVITYKNSGLDAVLKNVDLSCIVLETDAPYLPPTPHRGKRNLPAYLTLIADKIAETKNISSTEVALITTANSKLIFNK